MPQSCDSIKTTVLPPSFDSDDPPDLSISPKPGSGLGQQPVDPTGGDWIASPCNPKSRYRITSDGHIEVEGMGVPKVQWPKQVDKWRSLIEKAADANRVSHALLAGIVAVESGGLPNLISEDGRMGLAGLPRTLARQVANDKYPKDKTELDIEDDMILQPAWNLIHASKALSYMLKQNSYNMVGSLAAYDHASVECKTNAACTDDRWGMWTDCGYVDQAIACINTAVDEGYTGPRHVDLGPPTGDDQANDDDGSVLSYLLYGAVGVAAAFALNKAFSTKKGRGR